MNEHINSFINVSASNGNCIRIHVKEFENKSSKEGWILCDILVNVPSFQASYEASLEVEDFQRFYNDLRHSFDTLSGTAFLDTCEEWIDLKLEFSKNGCVSVEGRARNINYYVNNLYFEFNSDQTYIKQTINDLESLLVKMG